MTPRAHDILYGIHPVAEAMAANRRRFEEIYVIKDKPGPRIQEITRHSKSLKLPIHQLSREELEGLTGTDAHQGIAARTSLFPATDWAEMVMAPSDPAIFLLLDSIVDPQNLGALIRTALCVGAKGVVIPRDRSAGPTPVVSKTSAGALEHIRLSQVVNLVGAMKDLKKIGGWIIGLDASGYQSIYDTDFTGIVGIVIGGEETGIRPLVSRECDFLAHIPMSGALNSLNASVAGGVVLYEAFRQQNF
ncbi:MAG TPA: 23S rRNA (guanosine(2251)-2'-O)-methyltransferase RlmB [Desulfosalsimonadaceae bacterium]|nr:23S rRNA (guanosine(2251)-2'-O)-methyltransferase RlmB [Desulfosalsimonadaceae bacterium]